MLFEVIILIIIIILGTVVAIPVSALLVSLRARIRGRYLNRYYIVSRLKSGAYELHHQPVFGFYYAGKRKFYRLTMDAIRKFQIGYPDLTLIANTLIFSSSSRAGVPIEESGFHVTFTRFMADFLILCNLANYRREARQWRFAKLIKNVHQNKPMRYVLVEG